MKDESQFDAQFLRKLIRSGYCAEEIVQALNVSMEILRVYLNKLMKLDKKYYEICGLNPSPVEEDDAFWVTCDADGTLQIVRRVDS